jgi:hypothetical protein
LDGPYNWNNRPKYYNFLCCSPNATTKVITTKPMFMVFKWSTMILYLETWITWSMNSTYKFAKVDPCFAFECCGFLQCKTLNSKIGWATSTQIFSFNSRPPQDTKGRKLLELEGGCCMCTLSITLGSIARTIIHKQEKFTWSKRW